jgi:hypothetical protein
LQYFKGERCSLASTETIANTTLCIEGAFPAESPCLRMSFEDRDDRWVDNPIVLPSCDSMMPDSSPHDPLLSTGLAILIGMILSFTVIALCGGVFYCKSAKSKPSKVSKDKRYSRHSTYSQSGPALPRRDPGVEPSAGRSSHPVEQVRRKRSLELPYVLPSPCMAVASAPKSRALGPLGNSFSRSLPETRSGLSTILEVQEMEVLEITESRSEYELGLSEEHFAHARASMAPSDLSPSRTRGDGTKLPYASPATLLGT